MIRMADELKPEGYKRRTDRLDGWPIGVTTYRLGDKFICMIDNVDPGATIARIEAATAEDAEREARARARDRLSSTARQRETLKELRESVERLSKVVKGSDD